MALLQFGTGRFLRGFVDAFVHEADPGGRSVTAVASTASGTARQLQAQGCRYRLLVRGIVGGERIDTATTVTSIGRALEAATEWRAVLDAAVMPGPLTIVSNTTEAGYALAPDASDAPEAPRVGGPGDEDVAPATFPAKLLSVLVARARAGAVAPVVLPCELVERNGERLRELVVTEARRQRLDARTLEQVRDGPAWGVTLVDRIVTTPQPGTTGVEGDPLAVAAEPFASWIVALAPGAPLLDHPAIERVADVAPYALRKIRILNGAHSALVARCRASGVVSVREAMEDDGTAAWLEALLLDEVVPALGDRVEDGAGFARTVLERFRNPFLDHRLADIALHHRLKLETRLLPTFRDHVERLGRRPAGLARLLASEGVIA